MGYEAMKNSNLQYVCILGALITCMEELLFPVDAMTIIGVS